MPKTLSERPSKTLESLISLRLARLSAILARPVEDITRKAWVDALKFLTPTQIAAAFERLERTFIPTAACPFPVPAQLLGWVGVAEENKSKLDADQAWEDLMLWMSRWYFPDCRDMKRPAMQERIAKSVNAAGGLAHINSCSLSELAWAKKRFIEAYLSLGKLEEDRPLLASPEAIKQIGAIAEGKQLK